MLRSIPSAQRVTIPLSRARDHTPGGLTLLIPTPLRAITDAYAAGDAALGERLLLEALDQGLPWDAVCAAAAGGIASKHTETSGA